MLLLEKLALVALGIVCGGWLVGFIAGAHVQDREQAAFLRGRREGIEKARGKTAEPVDMPGEAPSVMASREPRPEEIAAARAIASDGYCIGSNSHGGISCNSCPAQSICNNSTSGGPWNIGDGSTRENRKAAWFRAWLAPHGIPVEEAAS